MKGQFVTIVGGRLHYLEWVPEEETEALPVVCLHGNLSNARVFRWIGDYPARYPRLSEDWVERTRQGFARTFDSWEALFAAVSPNGEMTWEEFEAEREDYFREREGRIEGRFDPAVIQRLQAESAYKDLSAALSGWTAPLLIIRGSQQGSLLSDEAVQAYLQLRPDARVVTIEGVGHEVFARQSDVVEALNAILD